MRALIQRARHRDGCGAVHAAGGGAQEEPGGLQGDAQHTRRGNLGKENAGRYGLKEGVRIAVPQVFCAP